MYTISWRERHIRSKHSLVYFPRPSAVCDAALCLDSYLGMDQDIPITVKVKQGKEVEVETEEFEQEDSDAFTDDDEDSGEESEDF